MPCPEPPLLPTYNRLSFRPFNSITITPTPTLFTSNFDFDEFDEPEESDKNIFSLPGHFFYSL
jgi:hypothetical protein